MLKLLKRSGKHSIYFEGSTMCWVIINHTATSLSSLWYLNVGLWYSEVTRFFVIFARLAAMVGCILQIWHGIGVRWWGLLNLRGAYCYLFKAWITGRNTSSCLSDGRSWGYGCAHDTLIPFQYAYYLKGQSMYFTSKESHKAHFHGSQWQYEFFTILSPGLMYLM